MKIARERDELGGQFYGRGPQDRHAQVCARNDPADGQCRQIDLGLDAAVHRLGGLVTVLSAQIRVLLVHAVARLRGRRRLHRQLAIQTFSFVGAGISRHRKLRKKQQADAATGDDLATDPIHDFTVYRKGCPATRRS